MNIPAGVNLPPGIDTSAVKDRLANPPMQVVERQVAKDDYKTVPQAQQASVFGSSFFTTTSLSFEPNLRIATPINYILGPDDELLLSVSGYQEANIKVQVQPEGIINIPQVGAISVAGLSIEDASARIRKRMAQTAYPNIASGLTKLNISLGKIRSIHVTVIGAAKPGNFTLSSLTTVFNSLYQSGGPGAINSYRSIQLLRNNRVYKTIDLYQFLTRGDQSGNVLLQEGDVINFPVYKKRVSITGEVKRPAIFEMLEGETLDNLLFFAGGFTDKAYKASVKIRQVTDTERRIKDLSKASFSTYQLANSDEIEVAAILDRVENSVSISGAVYRPGQFELTPGLTLKGLIQKADGLQEGVFMDRAILTRIREDKTLENISFNVRDIMNGSRDIMLQKLDEVQIALISDFKSSYSIQIEGEVRKPGSYPYKENFSLKDLLFLAGNFTDAGSSYHIEIGRRILKDNVLAVDTIAEVLDLNTERELVQSGSVLILKPFDLVTVRRNPGYIVQKRVTINGEVVYPGSYTLRSKQERVSDLIKRAGGLTPMAYAEGVFLTRQSAANTVNNNQIEKAALIQAVRDTSNKVIADVVRTNNRIAINAEDILKAPGSIDDYVLEEGDIIDVQKLDPLVKISGEVLLSTKTSYVPGRSLKYYISKAGGTTDFARKSRIYVLYPNGKVNQTHSLLFGMRSYPKVAPGAEVIVPTKAETKGINPREFINFTSALVSLASVVIVTISYLAK